MIQIEEGKKTEILWGGGGEGKNIVFENKFLLRMLRMAKQEFQRAKQQCQN